MFLKEKQFLCPGWLVPGQAESATALEAKCGPGSITFP